MMTTTLTACWPTSTTPTSTRSPPLCCQPPSLTTPRHCLRLLHPHVAAPARRCASLARVRRSPHTRLLALCHSPLPRSARQRACRSAARPARPPPLRSTWPTRPLRLVSLPSLAHRRKLPLRLCAAAQSSCLRVSALPLTARAGRLLLPRCDRLLASRLLAVPLCRTAPAAPTSSCRARRM